MTTLSTPQAPNRNGKYPSPAYLEGWFDLPDGSMSGNESLKISLGEMPQEVYMGYLGSALALRRRMNATKPRDGNEILDERPGIETKHDDSNETLNLDASEEKSMVMCLCGCGKPVEQSKTGRPSKFASSSCRVRYHRRAK